MAREGKYWTQSNSSPLLQCNKIACCRYRVPIDFAAPLFKHQFQGFFIVSFKNCVIVCGNCLIVLLKTQYLHVLDEKHLISSLMYGTHFIKFICELGNSTCKTVLSEGIFSSYFKAFDHIK